VPGTVFALLDDQFFVFPTEQAGFVHKVPLPSDSREVEVETLAESPRVFKVPPNRTHIPRYKLDAHLSPFPVQTGRTELPVAGRDRP